MTLLPRLPLLRAAGRARLVLAAERPRPVAPLFLELAPLRDALRLLEFDDLLDPVDLVGDVRFVLALVVLVLVWAIRLSSVQLPRRRSLPTAARRNPSGSQWDKDPAPSKRAYVAA